MCGIISTDSCLEKAGQKIRISSYLKDLKDLKMYTYPCSNCKIVIVITSHPEINAKIIRKAVEIITRRRKGSNISVIDFDQNQNAIDELSDKVSKDSTLAFLLGDETKDYHRKAKDIILSNNIDLLINLIPSSIERCCQASDNFMPKSNETYIYLNMDNYLYLAARAIQSIVALFKLPSICGLDLADVMDVFSNKRGWLMMAETSYANKFISVQQAIHVWKPYNEITAAFLVNVIFNDETQFRLDDVSEILDILEQETCSENNPSKIIASFTDSLNLNCDLQITIFGFVR